MTGRSRARVAAGCGVAIVAGALVGLLPAGADHQARASVETVFGPTKMWELHLELTAKEYDAMQPPAGGFGFGGPGGPP
jgi:hypothetical protein